MQFFAQKNNKQTWNLIPTCGAFAGQVVAEAEGVNMKHASFTEEGAVVGTIKALWGVAVLLDDIYDELDTIRSLRIGHNFNMNADDRLVSDSDGVKHSYNLRLLHGAKQLVLMGKALYAKGIF